jgi:MFS family permease
MLKMFIKKEIHHLYLNNLFRGIAFSLFGIFVPIYFLNLGYSLKSVFVYFLILQTFLFVSLLASYFLSRKFGYKFSIIANAPLTIIFILCLQFLSSSNISIYFIAIIAGVKSGFYYIPMHSFFSTFSKKNKKGTQLSNYTAFGQVAGLLGPLVGAVIATLFGFKYLFMIVLVFILISIIPLLFIKNFKPKNKIKIKGFTKFTRNHKMFFFGTILDNIEGEIEGVIWPIFTFIILKSLISIGWIAFLISLGATIFTLFIGRYYDKKNKYTLFRVGGILFSIVWVARAFYNEPFFIFASSLIAGFLTLMVSIPFESIFYEKAAKDKDQNSFILFREIPTYIGRALIWIIAIIFVANFKLLFIIAGLSYLILSFLKFGIKEHKNLKTSPKNQKHL